MSDNTSYYNTLIFTIIAGIVSVLLLLALMIKRLRQFLPFIITLEIGIFTVIAWCVIAIILNSQDLDKFKKESTTVQFDTCPDYFVRTLKGDILTCVNKYVYTDDKNNQYTMKLYPATQHLPQSLDSTRPNLDELPLMELDKDITLKDSKQKCAPLFVPQPPVAGTPSKYQYYDLLPWTTMRSKCASFYDE